MSTHNQEAHWHYTLREWQKPECKKYLDIIFQEDNIRCIYDIGANVGCTAYTFMKYVKENHKNIDKIYCFEPDNENMAYMRLKLETEIKDKLVECIEMGVYYGKTSARVFGAGHIEQKCIHPNVGGYGIEECMIEVINNRNKRGDNVFCDQVGNKVFQLDTLENLCESFISPDFIKIDVEGAEKNILINSTLIRQAKYMIVEWNQEEDIKEFIRLYLPDFVLLSSECDCLLKRIR